MEGRVGGMPMRVYAHQTICMGPMSGVATVVPAAYKSRPSSPWVVGADAVGWLMHDEEHEGRRSSASGHHVD